MDHKLQIILAAKDVTGPALRRFQSRLGSMTRSIFSFKGAIGALAGAGGIGLLINSSLKTADTIGKTADAVGLTTKALQEYQHAAELSGVSADKLNSNLLAFAKRIGEARQGTGALVTFLNQYDESLLEALKSTSSTTEALDLIFTRLGNMSSATDRAALSAAAFGRSGVIMTNMVKDGSAGLARMREEANRLGIVMGDKVIRNSEKANDAFQKLGSSMRSAFTTAVATNIDSLTKSIESMAAAFGKLAKYAGLRSVTRTYFEGAKLAEKKLLDWQKFVHAGFAERQRMVDDIINKQKQINQSAHELRRLGLSGPKVGENPQPSNSGKQKPVDTIERLLVPQKQWASLKAATKPGLDQLRSVREAAEEEAKAYAEEFQATVEIYSGDIIPQGVIDAQLTRMVEAAKEGAKNFVQPFENAFLSMGDALGDFVMSGKADIKSLLTSILSDLVHMETRMMAMSIFSGLGGSISGGGGGGSGSIGAIWSLLKHAGGTVDGSGPRRLVSPSTFAFAPRLHNGLRGDEYPAILQKGETVLPRGVGGGGDVDVIINNYSGQPASVQGSNDGPGGRRQIAVIIGEEFASGRLDKTMSQNYNLRRGGRTV